MAPRVEWESPIKGKKQANFTDIEIESLADAWLYVSGDFAVGTNQKGKDFWEKIKNQFHKIMLAQSVGTTKKMVVRSYRSLHSKWLDISHDCKKFTGALSQVLELDESGRTYDDQEKQAFSLYKQMDKKGSDFRYYGAWTRVKDSPKWQTAAELNENFREQTTNKRKDNTGHSNSDEGGECPVREFASPNMRSVRPMGSKKAKEMATLENRLLGSNGLASSHDRIGTALEKRAKSMEYSVNLEMFQVDLETLDDEGRDFVMMARQEILQTMRNRLGITPPLRQQPITPPRRRAANEENIDPEERESS